LHHRRRHPPGGAHRLARADQLRLGRKAVDRLQREALRQRRALRLIRLDRHRARRGAQRVDADAAAEFVIKSLPASICSRDTPASRA
jgi:hypothetical protein